MHINIHTYVCVYILYFYMQYFHIQNDTCLSRKQNFFRGGGQTCWLLNNNLFQLVQVSRWAEGDCTEYYIFERSIK